MTMTESPPSEAAELTAELPVGGGLYDWLSTNDHRTIGRLWLRIGLLWLVAASVVGVILGLERRDASSIDLLGGTNSFFQLWTLYRLGLVLLVVAPLFVGLATVVVPMQVGSSNIAFPRLALASAWGFIIGSGITVISVLAGGGWGALDGVTGDEAQAVALTLVGTGLVIVALLGAAVCVATTVVSLRTSGMNLMRVPLFAWSMLVTASVWLLTLPVALANIVIIYVDLRGGPLILGNPEGSVDIYAQLSWVVEQPQVYAIAIPLLGVIGSIISVVAGSRQVSHSAMVVLIGLFGLLSIGGWSQPHFFDNTDGLVFVAFGLVVIVVVLAFLGGSAATLMSGNTPLGLPPVHLLGALGSGLLLAAAAAAGAVRVIEPLDLAGTTVYTAVLNLTVAASITGVVAGMWFWAPKISGSLLPAGIGRLVVGALVAGGLLLGVGDLIAGFADAPVLMISESGDRLVEAMGVVSLIGALIVALGVFGVVVGVVQAGRAGVAAGDDPWDGHTLEWATSSPPVAGNFAEIPAKVISEAPLLDLVSIDEGGDS